MSAKNLIGLRLESCRFSRSSITLNFCGKIGGEYREFDVGTNYGLSDSVRKSTEYKYLSQLIWDYLETQVVDVQVDETEQIATFKFEEGGKLYFFHDMEPLDNLIIVRSKTSDEWFTIL